jgi:serine/threonine protein kinase
MDLADQSVTLVERPRRPGNERVDRMTDARIGTVVASRYRILEKLAIGGMGIVYRAERVGLGRAVAIKFLRSHVVHDADTRKRFESEARAASRLGHPNCVAVIDCGLDDDIPFIVMELVEGRTLRQILDAGPIAIPRALDFATQILDGLEHAHAHGVIHRDIKPDNILVWSDGTRERAQIADFGLARCHDALAISHEVLIGTPNYMSPEQTLGLRADERSDLYAVGILLYEMLAQRKPFRAAKMFDTLRMHRESPVPAFADIAPDRSIPIAVERVRRSRRPPRFARHRRPASRRRSTPRRPTRSTTPTRRASTRCCTPRESHAGVACWCSSRSSRD